MPPKRAAKRDENEKPIIKALEKVGAIVQQISETDAPDLLVGFRGQNYLLEVKNPDNYGKLRPGQLKWHAVWEGQVCTVETIDEALRAIGAIE